MTSEQKFVSQLSRLTPEYQERFYSELNKFFAETVFPSEDIPENFYRMRFGSLIHTTEQALQITTNNFLGLLLNREITEYSVGNIISICKGSEKTSLIDWIHVYGNTDTVGKDYADYRIAMNALTEMVNAIIEPEKDKLLRKMMTLQGIEVKSGRTMQLAP